MSDFIDFSLFFVTVDGCHLAAHKMHTLRKQDSGKCSFLKIAMFCV